VHCCITIVQTTTEHTRSFSKSMYKGGGRRCGTTLVATSWQLRHWGCDGHLQTCTKTTQPHAHNASASGAAKPAGPTSRRTSHARRATCLPHRAPRAPTCKVEGVAALLGGRVARVHGAEVAIVAVTRRAAPIHLQQQVGGPGRAADLAHRSIQLQEKQHRRGRQAEAVLLQQHTRTTHMHAQHK
jgi:hypothetical protein